MIRDAGTADVEDLADLAARTFPLACPPHMPASDIESFITEQLSAAQFGHYIRDEHHQVFVTDQLDGYVLLIDEGPRSYLSKCYVDPASHGNGIAGDLIEHAIDWAKRRGHAAMHLGVNSQNLRAQRFYAKHGFAVTGKRDFTIGGSVERDLVMERPLTP